MRWAFLLALIAGIAYGDIAMSGGDSFENATTLGEGEFPVGGSIGSDHYFYELVDAGTLLSVGKTCDAENATLPLYDEALQLLTEGYNATSRWSASSENQSYKVYFIIRICQPSTRIKVGFENRQDMNSGTDAGSTFQSALRVTSPQNKDCCFLSLNTSKETGNDLTDMYLLSTGGATQITVDTLAPLEITAYAKNGSEVAKAASPLSFTPKSADTYLSISPTAQFSSGNSPAYSLVITGMPTESSGPGGGPQSQTGPAAAGARNRTAQTGKNGSITEGGMPAPPEEGSTPDAGGKTENTSILGAIEDTVSRILDPAREEPPTERTGGPKKAAGSGLNAKKWAAILIAAGAAIAVIRARRTA